MNLLSSCINNYISTAFRFERNPGAMSCESSSDNISSTVPHSHVMASAVSSHNDSRPVVKVTLTPKKRSFTGLSKEMEVLADTGADVCIAGKNELQNLSLSEEDLYECEVSISGVLGGGKCTHYIPIEFKIDANATTQNVYFHNGTSAYILLSCTGCRELKMINESFPKPPKGKFLYYIYKWYSIRGGHG